MLVFSKTAGFRHSSIPNGIAAIQQLGRGQRVHGHRDRGRRPVHHRQPGAVPGGGLALHHRRRAQRRPSRPRSSRTSPAAAATSGVHAAADTEYDWPWYGGLVGAYFASHPANQQATVRVEDRGNASTAHLPATWSRTDEWYNYRTNPRANVRVLATLDESSYSGGTMGGDHPITWCQNYGGGRSWYTGLGHTEESYTDANFTRMLLGGIQIAAGNRPADCRPETGYTAIFDGTQASLNQWRQAGPGGFTLANGTLTSIGGMGLLWYPVRTYANYSLKLDWMMPGDDNGGVFIGFPDPLGDPWNPVNQGHEIQIDATDADPSRTTGSVYSFQAPNAAARDAALNPPGSWNTYEIGVHGQRVEIWLNGVKVNDYTSTRAIANGYVGVQNDGAGLDINYRNIRIGRRRQPAADRPRPGQADHRVQRGVARTSRPNAMDGNAATRWGSAYSDPQWITRGPGRHLQPDPGAAGLGDGVRAGVPDPDVAQQRHLDDRLLHDHR